MNPLATELSQAALSSPALAQLTSEQRERLSALLDRYLTAQEQGLPLEQESLLAEHPDLAETLQIYFRSLEELHDLAAGFAPTIEGGSGRESHAHDDPQRLGDFELVREIGRGGMGVVYEARQLSLDRRVALKLLPFASVLDSRQVTRFQHEAQAAARLHHPHIAAVFAIGVERGIHYYAMQLIDGQPLDLAIAQLRSDRQRDRAETSPNWLSSSAHNPADYSRAVAQLGTQAAEALQAAHEEGIVHRDIKPSNLLLETSGKLWITDFGLARMQRETSLTRTGDLVGTLRYMSPEQATGRSTLVDSRTDIYSLGVTLYELLCLRPAFPEKDGPALLRQIERHEPPRPRQLRPGIPAELETVILKAMAKERDGRYQTAQQLADDLRNVLAGQPTLAQPPTLVERLGRWERRHRKITALVTSALVVAVVALSIGLALLGREKHRTETNADRADRYFREAREVLDRFGIQLSERLADVPGTEQVRHELLSETRAYYQNFVEEVKSDPSLRAEMAGAYGKIATLLDEGGTPQEAVLAHRQAVQVFEQLAEADRENLNHQQQWAVAMNNLGLALARAGILDEASRQFARAIELQQQLREQSSDEASVQGELATSLGNLGLLQRERGELAAAQKSLTSALNLRKRLYEAQPTDRERAGKLAGACNSLAATYLLAQPQRAIELHRQALQLQVAAADADSENAKLRRDVAITLNNLATAYSRTSQIEEAIDSQRQAIAIHEQLAKAEPAARSHASDLAVSHNNLGLALCWRGDLAAAEESFRRALELQAMLALQSPDDAAFHSSLGGMHNNLGIVLQRTGRNVAAGEAFAQATGEQRIAIQLAPEVTRYRSFLNQHEANQARVPSQSAAIPTNPFPVASTKREL